MTRLAFLGWAAVVLVTLAPPAWLIGPGSILATVFTGTQHYMGYEGVEVIWIAATLPVLGVILKQKGEPA